MYSHSQTDLAQTNKSFVDPAINALFNSLKKDLDDQRVVIDRQREELNALRFTPNSSIGLNLVAKCAALKTENEELEHHLQQGIIEKYKLVIASQLQMIIELQKALKGN